MDIKKLRKLTKEGEQIKLEANAEARRIAELKAKEKEEQEKIELKRKISDSIEWIETQVEKEAKNGNHTYIYNCGDHYEDEFVKALKKHFKDLNPQNEGIPGSYCVNYEAGEYEDYVSNGIRFSW